MSYALGRKPLRKQPSANNNRIRGKNEPVRVPFLDAKKSLIAIEAFVDSKLPYASVSASNDTHELISKTRIQTKELLLMIFGELAGRKTDGMFFALKDKVNGINRKLPIPSIGIQSLHENDMEPTVSGYFVRMTWRMKKSHVFGVDIGYQSIMSDFDYEDLGLHGGSNGAYIKPHSKIIYQAKDTTDRNNINKNYESTINIYSGLDEAAQEIREHLFAFYDQETVDKTPPMLVLPPMAPSIALAHASAALSRLASNFGGGAVVSSFEEAILACS